MVCSLFSGHTASRATPIVEFSYSATLTDINTITGSAIAGAPALGSTITGTYQFDVAVAYINLTAVRGD